MTITYNGYGYQGEHNSRVLLISVREELRSNDIYIEFEKPSGKKLASSKLDLVDGSGYYLLPSELLTDIGYLKIQLVARDVDYIEKSRIYEYYIAQSINAMDSIESEFEDVLTELETNKADDLLYENNLLQLVANGKPIGNKIEISGCSDIDVLEFQRALEHISGYVIGYDCSSINEVLKEINKFYAKTKIVVNAVDSVSGESISASWTVMGATKEEDGYYYLIVDGTTWTMMVTCSGYVTQRIEFVVTDEDAKAGIKEFNVSMVARE